MAPPSVAGKERQGGHGESRSFTGEECVDDGWADELEDQLPWPMLQIVQIPVRRVRG